MLPELGNFSSCSPSVFRLFRPSFCLIGSKYQNELVALKSCCYFDNSFFVSVSFLLLTTSLPTISRCSTWRRIQTQHYLLVTGYLLFGGPTKVSLLLWVMILCIWTALFSVFSRNLPFYLSPKPWASSGLLVLGFYCSLWQLLIPLPDSSHPR